MNTTSSLAEREFPAPLARLGFYIVFYFKQ